MGERTIKKILAMLFVILLCAVCVLPAEAADVSGGNPCEKLCN